jgi:hypothetical protein
MFVVWITKLTLSNDQVDLVLVVASLDTTFPVHVLHLVVVAATMPVVLCSSGAHLSAFSSTISDYMSAVATTAICSVALRILLQFLVHQLQQSTQKALHQPQRGAKGIDCIHELSGETFQESFIYLDMAWRHGWLAGWLKQFK